MENVLGTHKLGGFELVIMPGKVTRRRAPVMLKGPRKSQGQKPRGGQSRCAEVDSEDEEVLRSK